MPVKQMSIEEQILAIQNAAKDLAAAIHSGESTELLSVRDRPRPPSRSSIGSIKEPDSSLYSRWREINCLG